jgi:hypothetical protein
MRFIPKNRILNYKKRNFWLLNKSQSIFANLLLVNFVSYNLLHLISKIAIAESLAIAKTAPTSVSRTGEVCSQNFEPREQISFLASTSIEISAWVSDPQIGVKALIQTFGSYLFNYHYLGGLNESQPNLTITQIWQNSILPLLNPGFNFRNPVTRTETIVNKIPLILISGGKPITIHADSRYQLTEILAKSKTNAIAAVDGTFFSVTSPTLMQRKSV